MYATGISSGGFFSNYLGATRSARFAAIASVVGGLAPAVAADYHPEEPVSVLILQGAGDPLVPLEGGTIKFHRGETVATKTTLQLWAEHDGCTLEVSEDLPDSDPKDGTRVRRTTHSGGNAGTEVILYTILGGGHTWPGGPQYLPEFRVGRVCRDIDANQVIWGFFVRYPKP